MKTSSIRGFMLLYMVASMKPLRSRTLRWADEQARQTEWLAKVVEIAREDYALAVEVAHLIGLVKGYGDTHERGREKYQALMALIPTLRERGNAAVELAGLRKAAMMDESGERLKKALAAICVSIAALPPRHHIEIHRHRDRRLALRWGRERRRSAHQVLALAVETGIA